MTAPETPQGPTRPKTKADHLRAMYGRALGGGQRRSAPERVKRVIREKQGGRCLYCDLEIGTIVRRRSRDIMLRPEWDHFVPFSYSRANNRQNWVLACHICNNIKGPRLFTTVVEVQDYVLARWAAKGYERPAPAAVGDDHELTGGTAE